MKRKEDKRSLLKSTDLTKKLNGVSNLQNVQNLLYHSRVTKYTFSQLSTFFLFIAFSQLSKSILRVILLFK